ncbi:DNA polymerase III subunit delta' [Helicobacter trogontum]|uniref:DNA polymerase III subunit delta n=2 Tax=Helicobacter trogontum TaxID=50960 RepID=A0ABQ0D4T8_9HELI|nr:DNA polymerase III subunit delta' [Helicobacter trogontum]MCI5787353.1 DNA polymerase III subunit delta' [Helicobacter trogontum]MDY5184742.1 DNA polymerase III subunit delta' [Helicobacter trogontum]
MIQELASTSHIESDSMDLKQMQDLHIDSKADFHAPSKINPQFITAFKKSCIIISNDFESEKNYLSNTYAKEDIRIYDLEELKIDDAHEIIEEAHIATTKDKIIAIFAFSYNHYAQNALLKILEEPPTHIIFMLYITARNKLIPTIFSRLVVFNKSKKIHAKPLELDLTRLTIPVVYEYVNKLEKEHISYEQGRKILSQILDSMIANNILLDEKGLERFNMTLHALYSKQSVHIALLPILLSLVKG